MTKPTRTHAQYLAERAADLASMIQVTARVRHGNMPTHDQIRAAAVDVVALLNSDVYRVTELEWRTAALEVMRRYP